jgi:uncharacterized Zn finger protein
MSRAAQPQPQPQPEPQPQPQQAADEKAEAREPLAPSAASLQPGAPQAASSPQRRFHQRPEGPRKVRDGLKLSTRDGPVARHPLAERWLQLIEARVPADIMNAGLEYARSGQVVTLHVLPGEIDARVQGTAPRPYTVRIGMPAFDDAPWQRVIEAMAGEAIHAAKLLAGELPPALDETLASLRLSLLPESGAGEAALAASCTCPGGSAGACKHVAAVAAMFADQLSNNPLLIFTLLGLPAERLIERLRQARAIHTHGTASAHGEADIPGSQVAAPPLESVLDDFWRGAGDLEEVQWQPPPGAVPHALLRRLGPSPMQGKFPMVGLLASIYDAVADAARQRGDAGDTATGESALR